MKNIDKITKLERVRGTQDIFPNLSLIYQKVYDICIKILTKNNYQFVILPTLEYEKLFINSLGLSTDIVNKEMYSFFDKKNRKIVLRPEGTASFTRLICQNKLLTQNNKKFFYWSNMFRYERPQKGRHREFWQLGVEMLGVNNIWADYQIISLICEILYNLEIKDFTFCFNYLGNKDIQEKYKEELKKIINKDKICNNCKYRLQHNFLRILDCLICKNSQIFPEYKDFWTKKDKDYISSLEKLLTKFKIPFYFDQTLVRGLDYYDGLVWEVKLKTDTKELLGGGRYNQLYKNIGNVNMPAIGFAIGIERLINNLPSSFSIFLKKIDIFFFILENEYFEKLLEWKKDLNNKLIIEYNLEIQKKEILNTYIKNLNPKFLVFLKKKENKKLLIKDLKNNKIYEVNEIKLIEWLNTNF